MSTLVPLRELQPNVPYCSTPSSMGIDNHNLFEFKLLKYVENDHKLSNRLVARKLGVSVRLAHDILKKMVQKGLLHVRVVHARRWDYFLTSKGVMEKARLTMEFFDFSMHFYGEARKRSAQVCRELAENGVKDIAFLGARDLAEITYLGVQEWKLNLLEVYDECDRKTRFFNLPILPLNEISSSGIHTIIVCMYNKKEPMKKHFLPNDVKVQGKLHWIF